MQAASPIEKWKGRGDMLITNCEHVPVSVELFSFIHKHKVVSTKLAGVQLSWIRQWFSVYTYFVRKNISTHILVNKAHCHCCCALSPPTSVLQSCPHLVSVYLHFTPPRVPAYFPAFHVPPCSCSALILQFFMLVSKPASPQMKWSRVGWREPISSSHVKISRGSLERMLCVKEPAKWQNTVGRFIIIFLLLCTYNDCPHYKIQDDVHNYITLDSSETGASIVCCSWCLFDNSLMYFCIFLCLFICN